MLAAMRREYPNHQAALRWAITNLEIETCLQFCDALLPFWNLSNQKDAEVYLEEAVTLGNNLPPSPSYVNTLASAGFVATRSEKKKRGKELLEHCLAMNKAIGDQGSPIKIGVAYGLLAWNMFNSGDYVTACKYRDDALDHAYKTGDNWNLAMQLSQFGLMDIRLGNIGTARTLTNDGLVLHRNVGQTWGIALALRSSSSVHIHEGELSLAKKLLQESHTLSEGIEDKGGIANTKQLLALIALEEENYTRASTLLQEALNYQHESGKEINVLELLAIFVRLSVCEECHEKALYLGSAVNHHTQRLGIILPPLEQQQQDECIAAARQHLGENASVVAWAAGESTTLDEAVSYALR